MRFAGCVGESLMTSSSFDIFVVELKISGDPRAKSGDPRRFEMPGLSQELHRLRMRKNQPGSKSLLIIVKLRTRKISSFCPSWHRHRQRTFPVKRVFLTYLVPGRTGLTRKRMNFLPPKSPLIPQQA
jgi:hypothetical protein